jgi:Xaa-Pro aminopeptidase
MLEGSAFTLNEAANMEQIISSAGAAVIKSNELDNLIARMRIIKTANEVENIRTAQRITEEALSETLKLINDRITEKDLALELEYRMRKKGADGISFDLITISGKKTSMPHGVPGDRKIQKGDFITMDFGVIYQGYCSDMTRTVALGHATEEMKKVYDTVLQAQLAGIAATKAGVTGKQIDAAARQVITDAGYGDYFGHGYGHSLGMEVHESPNCNPKGETPMAENMVTSAEPGIYLPGKFGVRIEDVVVFTKDGCEILTASPKNLIII